MLFSKDGKAILLDAMRPKLRTLNIDLFKNDITPGQDTKLNDFVPCDFPGYKSLKLHHWSPVYIADNGAAATAAAMRRWTQTGLPTPLQTVYGYFVWTDNGWFVWGERDPVGGQLLTLAPQDYWVSIVMTFDGQAPPMMMSAKRPKRRRRVK